MVLLLNQVLQTNGLLLRCRIPGIKLSFRRSSPRPIRFLPRCPKMGPSRILSSHASSPTVHGCDGSTRLRDIQEFLLAGSFRSQGCPYLYHVRYFNGRRLQLPTEGPAIPPWFCLKEQYSRHFTCGWSHPKSQFYGYGGPYHGSWFWSYRHGTVHIYICSVAVLFWTPLLLPFHNETKTVSW